MEPARDFAVVSLPHPHVGGREPVVRMLNSLSADVDHDPRSDQSLDRHLAECPSVLGEVIGCIDVGPPVLRAAERVRGIKIAGGGRTIRERGQLERRG